MRPALWRSLAVVSAALLLNCNPRVFAADQPSKPEIMPLSEIKTGMKGVAYTIFAGDEIEPMDLEVLGVLPNALGPKQDVILVELKGAKVEHSGVVAGMSGSPVYINGKLVGALSLKLGIFTKEAIGGVTPIENMLDIQKSLPQAQQAAGDAPGSAVHVAAGASLPLPEALAQRMGVGAGNFLTPIETPLVVSGLYPQTLARYASELSGFGLTATEGGTAAPRADDSQIKPGSMVGMVLMRGDLSIQAGCTVTAIIGDRVFVCGHPVLGTGAVSMPMARGYVVTTLNSSLASTKIMNVGGEIGTFTQDRLTAVMGRLGAGPAMIPIELSISSATNEKQFHFEMIENRQFTPLLMALATFNGVVANTVYSEGSTLRLTGKIEIEGHTAVELENLFAPTEIPIPDGFFIALTVQSAFTRIFTNPYEQPHIRKISLQVTSLPASRQAAIDSAWSEKSEVTPGETIHVKVLLRPYRGAPFIQEIPITIPPQVARGNLRVLISDSETLNRMNQMRTFGPASQLNGLEELIQLMNRDRRNDRLYVTLLQPTPTLFVEDKEMPNVPLSEINVLDGRRNPGGSMLQGESVAGEWSAEMNQVITGQHYLTIIVR